MIYLDIVGDIHCPATNEEIKEAFDFALKELMPRKRRLDVTIDICDTGDSACGWHMMEEKYVHHIELNPNQSRDDFFTCLFHEMVHVRQSERGTVYNEDLPYYERPYEIEAYELQEVLWNKFQNSN